jgi:phosphatidate cytidylyltransferase
MNKNQVLLQRSITGIIFGLVVIGLVFSGKLGMMILATIIAMGAGYEYLKIVQSRLNLASIATILASLTSMLFIYYFTDDLKGYFYFSMILLSCVVFILGIIHLFLPFVNHKKWYGLICVLYFGLPLGLLITFVLKHETYLPVFWIYTISMVWICDVFAYLIGSRVGKHKLLEQISPKKTWEGFIGGGLCTIMVAFWMSKIFFSEPSSMYFTDFSHPNTPLYYWILISVSAWLIGTLGDLVESSIKRNFDVKDSGSILPGHGGIFDRFDSFIYILPFVLLLWSFFNL